MSFKNPYKYIALSQNLESTNQCAKAEAPLPVPRPVHAACLPSRDLFGGRYLRRAMSAPEGFSPASVLWLALEPRRPTPPSPHSKTIAPDTGRRVWAGPSTRGRTEAWVGGARAPTALRRPPDTHLHLPFSSPRSSPPCARRRPLPHARGAVPFPQLKTPWLTEEKKISSPS